ncbi:dephospho-CoA kinase [Chondrinema litorale]|uniref:dephospho-CoA kinase n=1 Tax=Chondrinema litorale TaxID=2994555 RepID=UPI002544B267|nr:dephospho-CoA kinase [Chondrinema litorale]UZR95802.1 dephospho-CoA kinase [Chondrinema litorale]
MKKNKPLIIGITGGIGSGKSVVCRIFKSLGIPVYDSDSRAKWLMRHSKELINEIKKSFGENAYLPDGQINNKYLAENVFHDKEKLRLLSSLTHPAVGKDFQNWVEKNQSQKYLLKEAALIFEAGIYKTLDKTILVTAPQEIKIDRVLKRDPHRDKAQVLAIMDKQMSDEEKVPLANYLILNDDTQMVLPQVLKLHKEFNKQEV